MSLFSPKKDGEVFLVFDIGSGSVGGAIVLTSQGHHPRILYNFRSDIPFQEEATGVRLLSLMLRALSQVVLAITHEGFDVAGFFGHRPRIREALISLSAPWVVSKTSLLKLRNSKPMPITPETFMALLRESASETDSERGVPKGSVQIEQKLIKSVIDGYEAASPYEKVAREAEFAVFGSFSLPKVTERVSDSITQLIHCQHVSFHSFALAAFAVLREQYPNEENFILTDVSGEQTELSIVKKGVLAQTATFPFGRNHLIRALRKGVGLPPGGAAALFKMHAEQSGTGRFFERAEKIIEIAARGWRDQFSKTLSAFSEEVFLPRTIFLTADDDVIPLFKRMIAEGDFTALTISPAAFEVVAIGSDVIASLVTWNPSLPPDPFLGLICVFANQLRR